jgi:hypothetical protein
MRIQVRLRRYAGTLGLPIASIPAGWYPACVLGVSVLLTWIYESSRSGPTTAHSDCRSNVGVHALGAKSDNSDITGKSYGSTDNDSPTTSAPTRW